MENNGAFGNLGKGEFWHVKAYIDDKEINQDLTTRYSITLHCPDRDDIKCNDFLLTGVDKSTGEIFFSAMGLARTSNTIRLIIHNLQCLMKLLTSIHDSTQKAATIKEIQDLLKDLNQES